MSTAATTPRANETVYCAAKWGARGFTEALRVEAKGTPLRILAVYPGGMNTPFWSRTRGGGTDSSRFMSPGEVAAAICEAVRPRSSCYVSDLVLNRL